ncbi:uncharacterized protein LOC119671101 [Teleopsis dalmanni]|uniref:uncharacterized protein LOC119671101 n=1 Tax=Teleopsis dalmanni TaxID=139649 RepID=UPI0018CE9A65|nr:uncharacterized protein LOC119671101 [Teleopsis dalmanni]
MDEVQKEQIVKDLLECTNIALDVFGTRTIQKRKLITDMLTSCEIACKLPAKKKRSVWVKRRRSFEHRKESNYDREEIGMNPTCFKMLLNYIRDDVQKKNTTMREAIPAAEKFASILKFFVSGESFKSLYESEKIKLSTAFISKATPEVCKALWNKLKDTYLKFPSTIRDWKAVAEDFSKKCDFPNCLGVLQTKHIYFKGLRRDGDYYRSASGRHSVKLLALVDANYKFLYTDVGATGQKSDVETLAQSTLQEILHEADDYFPRERIIGNNRKVPYVIVGSDSMPLHKHLLKPYPAASILKKHQVFNIRLAVAKHVADHAFHLLENKFKLLKSVIMLRADTVELITLTMCIIHNFMLEFDEEYKNEIHSDILIQADDKQRHMDDFSDPEVHEAEEVRLDYMEYFNEEGLIEWEVE